MTIQAEHQPDQEVAPQEACDMKSSVVDTPETSHISLPVQCETIKTDNSTAGQAVSSFSLKMKRIGRAAIFLGVIIALVAGRFSVPDNEVPCVQDKVMEGLGFANTFINTPGNEVYRDLLLFVSSLMLDIIFIATLGYWVMHGRSGRLPVTLAIFYGTRAFVQSLWLSPFPEGNYWYAPFGVPSLVVPYGRQSDFFFSGHAGFLIICINEWHKLKMPKIRNFVLVSAIYTMLILVIFRTHYSIDVFTGVVFAELCYTKADKYRETIDKYWMRYLLKLRNLFGPKAAKIPCLNAEKYHLTSQQV